MQPQSVNAHARQLTRGPIIKLPCSGVASGGTPFDSELCSYGDLVGRSEAAMDVMTAQGVDVEKYLYK